MKLLSLFLASSSFAQEGEDDRGYLSYYDYGVSNYDTSYYSDSYDLAKFTNQANDVGRSGNGLYCWHCHGRLKLSEAESNTNNAWYFCATSTKSGVFECQGDERVCLTEERKRYDITTEVKALCKTPESCLYQWRRNERWMPFFHLFGDQSENAEPQFFDDECIVGTNSKFAGASSQRSQWESTCRTCCKALPKTGTGMPTQGCNGPDQTAQPLGKRCTDAAGAKACADAFSAGAAYDKYSIQYIDEFLRTALHHGRAHPGEGRNSLPEDKFASRTNVIHQSDKISLEDMDFHNNRVFQANNANGQFTAT